MWPNFAIKVKLSSQSNPSKKYIYIYVSIYLSIYLSIDRLAALLRSAGRSPHLPGTSTMGPSAPPLRGPRGGGGGCASVSTDLLSLLTFLLAAAPDTVMLRLQNATRHDST